MKHILIHKIKYPITKKRPVTETDKRDTINPFPKQVQLSTYNE